MLAQPGRHPSGDLAQRHLQHISDLPQSSDGWVDDAAFDAADVRAVEAALSTQALLGEAGLFAELADNGADRLLLEVGRLKLGSASLQPKLRA